MVVLSAHNKRFVYVFFASPDRLKKIREIGPAHVGYWRGLHLPGYCGGPFSDASGGVVSFCAENLGEAMRLVVADPLVTEGLVVQKWVKEWVV